MGKGHIVLANDDEKIVRNLTEIFAMEDWKVHPARTSDEVIPKIEAFSPGLLILDAFIIPGGMGYVFERMTERDYQLPVLIWSAFGDSQPVQDILRKGSYRGRIEVVPLREDIESTLGRVRRLAGYH